MTHYNIAFIARRREAARVEHDLFGPRPRAAHRLRWQPQKLDTSSCRHLLFLLSFRFLEPGSFLSPTCHTQNIAVQIINKALRVQCSTTCVWVPTHPSLHPLRPHLRPTKPIPDRAALRAPTHSLYPLDFIPRSIPHSSDYT